MGDETKITKVADDRIRFKADLFERVFQKITFCALFLFTISDRDTIPISSDHHSHLFSFFFFFFFFVGKRKRTIDYAAVIDENNWDTRTTSSRIKRLDHRISFLLLFSVISSSKPRFAFGIELDQRDIIYSSSADRARDSKFEN